MHIVDIAYDSEKWSPETDRRICDLVGKQSVSSGMGFGFRDHQFEFDRWEQAQEAVTKLASCIDPDLVYISCYPFGFYLPKQ